MGKLASIKARATESAARPRSGDAPVMAARVAATASCNRWRRTAEEGRAGEGDGTP